MGSGISLYSGKFDFADYVSIIGAEEALESDIYVGSAGEKLA